MNIGSSLRIALLTHSTNPRGGVVHVLELADALVARGHAVTVFAPATRGKTFFRLTAALAHLIPANEVSGGLSLLVKQRVDEYVKCLQPIARNFDIFHAHDGMSGYSLAQLSAAEAIPGFVRTVHHLDAFDDPYLRQAQDSSVAEASTVLCVSRMWADKIYADFGKPAVVVTNGVDTARFNPSPQSRDQTLIEPFVDERDHPLFMCVGGIEKRKNTAGALRAFLAARPELPTGAALLIVGGASLLDHSEYRREFDSILAGVGNPRSIRVVGPVADEVMPALYRRADVLLFPSLVEGFGLATLEAMACGTPVVTSRIPPFTEYLTDDDALLVDPRSVAEMRAAILKSLDPSIRARVIERGLIVTQRFPWPRSAELHEHCYESIMSRKGDPYARNAIRHSMA